MTAFIILHYSEKALADTLECIDSCQKLRPGNQRIVVVENGSGDSSSAVLREEAKRRGFDLVISPENKGFSRGNNLGCRHAIREYSPNFLVVLNNDTVVESADFLEQLDRTFSESPFDICGPYLRDRRGLPQNPLRYSRRFARNFPRYLWEHRINYLMARLFGWSLPAPRKTKPLPTAQAPHSRETRVGLHGSALIFSQEYFRQFPDVIPEYSFMYGEEEFLYLRVLQNSLRTVYEPRLRIYHKEDASTDAAFGHRAKVLFKLRHLAASFAVVRRRLRSGAKI